jgi:hypothetical protein
VSGNLFITLSYIRSAVVYKALLGQVFLLVLGFSPGSIFPPTLRNPLLFIHLSAIDCI